MRYRVEILFSASEDAHAVTIAADLFRAAERHSNFAGTDLEMGDVDKMKARWEFERSVTIQRVPF